MILLKFPWQTSRWLMGFFPIDAFYLQFLAQILPPRNENQLAFGIIFIFFVFGEMFLV